MYAFDRRNRSTALSELRWPEGLCQISDRDLPAIFFCALKAHCDANLLKSMTKTRSVRVESKAFSLGEALYCRLRMGKDGVKRLFYSQKMLVITMS